MTFLCLAQEESMPMALFDRQWRIYWLLLIVMKLQDSSFEPWPTKRRSEIMTGDDLMMMKARVGGTGKAVVQLLSPHSIGKEHSCFLSNEVDYPKSCKHLSFGVPQIGKLISGVNFHFGYKFTPTPDDMLRINFGLNKYAPPPSIHFISLIGGWLYSSLIDFLLLATAAVAS